MKKCFAFIWQKLKSLCKWMIEQLKDKKNWVIFLIVVLVVSCEIWIPLLLGFITGNAWWYGIAAACWAFWLAPFVPFLPICIAITVGVRKILNKIQKK